MQIRFFFIIILSYLFSTDIGARNRRTCIVDTLSMNAVVQRYTALLNALVWETSNLQTDSTVRFTPYYFRLFAPGTLYDAPMKQEFGVKWNFTLPGREKNVPSLLNYTDSSLLI